MNQPTNHPAAPLNPTHKNTKLWQDYQDLRQDKHGVFPTEGAKMLGVSELELLLSSPHSTYLGTDCRSILEHLHTLGVVENIVRNDYAVHEKTGQFLNLQLGKSMGMILGEHGLDLRFFLNHWRYALAIANTDSKPSYCIAFFDEYGNAINKAFLTKFDQQHIDAWQNLMHQFAPKEPTDIALLPNPPQQAWQLHALDDDSLGKFRQQWQDLTDIHAFHGILQKHNLDRISSYVQAPQGMSVQVKADLLEELFCQLASEELGCMIFVGNGGTIQIHSGTIKHIKRLHDWLNIMDKKHSQFTSHLKDTAISQLWFTKKPHSEGLTLGFEGFDEYGNSIITVFGERVEGQNQDPKWQHLATDLVEKHCLD